MTLYEICQTVLMLGALAVSIWNARGIKQVHNLTNSKMTELVSEVREGSLAKGKLEGQATARAEEEAKKPL